jgi:hypothetical protein
LAGDKVIVSGCIEAGGVVSDGFVIINGELLKFKGTAISDFVVIQEVARSSTEASKTVLRNQSFTSVMRLLELLTFNMLGMILNVL